jgi:hypothetical protein
MSASFFFVAFCFFATSASEKENAGTPNLSGGAMHAQFRFRSTAPRGGAAGVALQTRPVPHHRHRSAVRTWVALIPFEPRFLARCRLGVARLRRVGSLNRRRSDLCAQIVRERLERADSALGAMRAGRRSDARRDSIRDLAREAQPGGESFLEFGGGHDQSSVFSVLIHGATVSASATNSRAIRIERRAMELRVRNSKGALASLDPGKEIIVFAPLESDFFVDASRIAKLFDFLRAHPRAWVFREEIVDAIERPTRLRELRD